jgi:osmotically-inducible protein OsmY
MKKKLAILTASVLLAAPVFGATYASAQGQLEEKVGSELNKLPYFGVFDNLSFTVDADRQVTLYGQVTRPTLKRDAENAIKRLTGVEVVDNRIEVLPLSNFDNDIRVRAYYAIFGSPALSRYALAGREPIHIVVKNGNVTLEGVVNSEVERLLAFSRVRGLPGTFAVTNNLRLDNAD